MLLGNAGLKAKVETPASARIRADNALPADLPPEVDPCDGNGEFHSVVSAGPMLTVPIAVRVGALVEREGFVFADVLAEAEWKSRRASRRLARTRSATTPSAPPPCPPPPELAGTGVAVRPTMLWAAPSALLQLSL
jgi:hypothetical protein